MGYDCLADDIRDAVVQELEELDDKYLAVEREHEAQRLALKQRYELRYAALLERRREVLAGGANGRPDAPP